MINKIWTNPICTIFQKSDRILNCNNFKWKHREVEGSSKYSKNFINVYWILIFVHDVMNSLHTFIKRGKSAWTLILAQTSSSFELFISTANVLWQRWINPKTQTKSILYFNHWLSFAKLQTTKSFLLSRSHVLNRLAFIADFFVLHTYRYR